MKTRSVNVLGWSLPNASEDTHSDEGCRKKGQDPGRGSKRIEGLYRYLGDLQTCMCF